MWPFSLLGSPKKAGEIAGKVAGMAEGITVGVIDGIDAAWYTEEEKARHAMEAMKLKMEGKRLYFKMMAATAGENSIRSITRRYLAFGVLGPYMSLIVMACCVYYWSPKWSKYILEVLQAIWAIPFAVTCFYFGPYELKKINFFNKKGGKG